MIFSSVFLALVAFGAAVPITTNQQAADQTLLQRQNEVIQLLENIVGEIPNEHLSTIGHTYDIEGNLQSYENPNLVKYLATAVRTNNVQPKGTVFSTTVNELRQEAVLLTRILLGARDWKTFINTAAWARVHLNEPQFLSAFVAAIVQRQDTQGIILPPVYEILPQNFFDSRVIQEVQNIKSRGIKQVDGKTIIIPINYTSHLPTGEHRIAYFTEDIGLNYYYTFLQLIGSLVQEQTQKETTGTQQPTGHGAQWLYLQQQLVARYNLERHGNNLGPIPELDLKNVNIPFKPHLSYLNGLEMPGRTEGPINVAAIRPELYRLIRTLEQRLLSAIDSGRVITPSGALLSLYQPQGLNILGNLIEGSGRSVNPRYYGSLLQASKVLLSGTPEFDNIWEYTPAALELSSVATRDPALYVLLKQITQLVQRYQESLPAHQWNDIVLPGVQIERVGVSKLMTYFEDYLVNLNNAGIQGTWENLVKDYQQQQQQKKGQETQQGETGLNIKGLLKRLNHLPYELEIVAQSQQNIPNAVVRVFIGPKFTHEGLPIDINANREDFVELDQWIVDLTTGQNVITRKSRHSSIQGIDHPSVDEMIPTIERAMQSQQPLYTIKPQQLLSFPARLSLPKGSYGGNQFQILVVISAGQKPLQYGPITPYSVNSFHSNQWQTVNADQYEQMIAQPTKDQTLVDVVPDFTVLGGGINQGKWQWTNLYNRYQGYYSQPQWRHTLQNQQWQGVRQGQTWGVQGQGIQGQTLGVQGQGIQGQTLGVQGQGIQGQTWGVQGQVPQGQNWGVQGQGVQGQNWGVQGQGVQGQTWGVQGQGVQGQTWGVQGIQGQGIRGQGVQGQGVQGLEWNTTGVEGQDDEQNTQRSGQIVEKYYNNLPISQVIGGAISLDGKPFGWPLDRPIAPSAWSVPNVFARDVVIYHQDVPVTTVPRTLNY
ncbi:hexamerin-like [Leptopilina heterotoma]|uniref:hexamerin-like n=1 Tax=Leptopilina heterotoma TaxID=63436 RepID=UPI001CA9E9CA|nr:hexamerin-like [Leptopilina heterotoma]